MNAKSNRGLMVWSEQATGWQRKLRVGRRQALNVENDGTAVIWVVRTESDR